MSISSRLAVLAVLVASNTVWAAGPSGLVAYVGRTQKLSDKEVLVEQAKAVSYAPVFSQDAVDQFGASGFSAMTASGVTTTSCKEAVVVIKGGQGNVLPMPDGREIYFIPEIVSFTCINN